MEFQEIYKAYWPRIFRLCMGYVNDSDWAKDIAQETFITVWQKLPQFRNESSLSTWIFRIASNQCLRQMSRQKGIPKTEMPADIEDSAPEDTEAQIRFLYQCISALPEIDRIIISLELENIRQAEIANITGLSESNIRVKIFRIKEKLSKKFKTTIYE